MGYYRAGFEVVGVDIKPQPRYPFEFHQGDALEFCAAHGREFDAIHASPPCQAYSRMRHLPWLRGREYPELIDATRKLLISCGVPYVIENVEDAPLQKEPSLFGVHGIWLCGQMFGLPLYRHRAFESSRLLSQPPHPQHRAVIHASRLLNKRYSQSGGVCGVIVSVAGHTKGLTQLAPIAMGIDWMKRDELTQAVPPVMTEFIGAQLLRYLAPS